jgi:hypothetical protein
VCRFNSDASNGNDPEHFKRPPRPTPQPSGELSMGTFAESVMLQKHGTKVGGLKPVNIIQAAQADLKLKERKKDKTAEPGSLYSFARKHVQRANSVGHLIASAYFDPKAAASTDKKSTYIVYLDRDVLRRALLDCIEAETE